MCTHTCLRQEGEEARAPPSRSRPHLSARCSRSKKTAHADRQTPPLTVSGGWEGEVGLGTSPTFTGRRPLPRDQARLFFQEEWLNITGRQVTLPDGVGDQVLRGRQGGGAGTAACRRVTQDTELSARNAHPAGPGGRTGQPRA